MITIKCESLLGGLRRSIKIILLLSTYQDWTCFFFVLATIKSYLSTASDLRKDTLKFTHS